MLYETSLNTTVKVKDGPTVSDKYTDPEVTAIYEKKIIFPAKAHDPTGRFAWSCPKCFDAEGLGPADSPQRLAFVSIQATRYSFDDCGEKKPGVAIILPGGNGQPEEKFLLESGRVFVDQPGADLKRLKHFQVAVNTELFTCPKGNDDILVTIAYAVKTPASSPDYLKCLNANSTCAMPASTSGNTPDQTTIDWLNAIEERLKKLESCEQSVTCNDNQTARSEEEKEKVGN